MRDDHPVNWRKARRSKPYGDCLEVSGDGGVIAVRDTRDRAGPALARVAGVHAEGERDGLAVVVSGHWPWATVKRRRQPPEPLPVPPPAVTWAPGPPYRACQACGVTWRGDDDCWSPTHPSQLPQ